MEINSELKLFRYNEDNWVTAGDLFQALRQVGADKCKVLFLHTGLSFGCINREIKRKELCQIILDIIKELKVETLVFPTFTFSYGNKEDFDVRNTPTKMGMLNEYVRNLPESVRSVDPMLSVAVIGKNKDILNVTGEKSLGAGCIFDNLHKTEGVKFLFLGTSFGQCGTHMHYVEEKLRVPYRYDMDFYGKITDYDGTEHEAHRILYVKYRDIKPGVPASFEKELVDKGKMLKCPLGESNVFCISEKDMYDEVYNALSNNVNIFLLEPYTTYPLVKEYSYGNVTTVQ